MSRADERMKDTESQIESNEELYLDLFFYLDLALLSRSVTLARSLCRVNNR